MTIHPTVQDQRTLKKAILENTITGCLWRVVPLVWLTLYSNSADAQTVAKPEIAVPDRPDPDIPLVPPTAEDLRQISLISDRFWQAQIVGKPPNSAAVATAKEKYEQLDIQIDGTNISGTVPSMAFVDEFVYVLARQAYHASDETALVEALNGIWLTIDQGYGEVYYDSRNFFRAVILLRQHYTPQLYDLVQPFLREKHTDRFWDPLFFADGHWENTDYIYTGSEGLFGTVLFFTGGEAEILQHLKGLKRHLDRTLRFSPGTANFIKVDGTSFHHWTHYPHYMYTYKVLADHLYHLRETPFQIERESYLRLRDVAYGFGLYMGPDQRPISVGGRFPLSGENPIDADAYRTIAEFGGELLGTEVDEKIARYYNRIFGDYDPFLPYGKEPTPNGFWQFNYSAMGIYRHGEWVATVKGFNRMFWGAEIYQSQNRYGRYQSYGALEITYPGGRLANGIQSAGWNWNGHPGTTTISLPWEKLVAQADRQDERTESRFCGALRFTPRSDGLFGIEGASGMFAMDFRQNPLSSGHDATFAFQKSVIAVDGMLIALGTGITNQTADAPTVTTLCQGALATPQTPIAINGETISAFPHQQSLDSGNPNWLIDPFGTGYWIGPDTRVEVRREVQSTPDQSGNGAFGEGNFATCWLDHGTAPQAGTYEFAVLPGTSPQQMDQFAQQMNDPATRPYTVHQQNRAAHIVALNDTETYAYALFQTPQQPLPGPVKHSSAPCLVMARGNETEIRQLTLTNPDLGIEYRSLEESEVISIELTVAGAAPVSSASAGVTVISSQDEQTRLRFDTRHGLPQDVVFGSGDADGDTDADGDADSDSDTDSTEEDIDSDSTDENDTDTATADTDGEPVEDNSSDAGSDCGCTAVGRPHRGPLAIFRSLFTSRS